MGQEPEAIAAKRRALGERLNVYRRLAGVTQQELGRQLYCDRTTIARVEAGQRGKDRDFWQRADQTLTASGILVASFDELETARQRHAQQLRRAELSAIHEQIASWRRRAGLVGEHPGGRDIGPDLGLVVDLLGPDQATDALDMFTRSVIDRYEQEGPRRLAPELRAVRGLARDLSQSAVSSMTDRTRLTSVYAQQAALLAYMFTNAGQFQRAEAYALEATVLATSLGDSVLLAWIKGTQSLTAYYQRRYHDALRLAKVGLDYAGRHPERIRLLSNGVARAAGKLGDKATVEQAVGEALELAERQHDRIGMTSCIDFEPYSWARTAANGATAFLSVGDHRRVLDLIAELQAVVGESDSDWSRSLVSLDEATALTLGHQADVEHAVAIGMRALAASATKPIASVGKRAAELVGSLQRHGPHPASQDFAEAVHEWDKSMRALPA